MQNNWIEWKWTPEKPYPETLKTRVHIKCRDGWEGGDKSKRSTVAFWRLGFDNWIDDNSGDAITHYRIAED